MKIFVAPGQVLTLTAPAGGVTSGQPLILGALFVVPKNDAGVGEVFTALWGGIFNLAKKAADTPGQLDKAYWDADAEELTTASVDNTLVGVFNQTGVATQTEIEVLLTGVVV